MCGAGNFYGETKMKYGVLFVMAGLCLSAMAEITMSRTVHWTSLINAQDYTVEITGEMLTNVPPYKIASGAEPVLSISAAHRIAEKEYLRLREPAIDYTLESIQLEHFHNTDHWYYIVKYCASGEDWQEKEPYKSRIKANPAAMGKPPRISIVILLDGTVVEQKLWDSAR
jgi:hypothetical protein